ncbi:MAG: ECF-type sigma factor [Pirellulales bacterium]
MNDSRPITVLLTQAKSGNPEASRKLWESVYDEIRVLSQRALDREFGQPTLQATELAHEAYLKLVGSSVLAAENRSHLLATVAKAIRQLLVDRARARKADKRGGKQVRVLLDDILDESIANPTDLLDLNDALEQLALIDSRHAKLVELRYFGGMTLEEAADELDLSRRTLASDWALAKAWLRRYLDRGRS